MDPLDGSIRKKVVNLVCECCDYTTSRRSDYDKHLLTLKHQKYQFVSAKKSHTFCCQCCDYTTSRKSDYNNHLLSKKHCEVSAKYPQESRSYFCDDCGYTTNIKTNYNKHLSSQKHRNAVSSQNIEPTSLDNKVIIQLLLDNQNVQNKLIEHIGTIEKTIGDITTSSSESIKQLSTALTNVSNTMQNITTNISNTVITNNNTANINIFLNERCKDAMNMTDFLKTIKYTAESLKHMEQNGFANTITKLFADQLHTLSLYERPIHCTDIKREIIYIKDNDEWQKNTEEQTMRDKMVNKYIPIMERDNRLAFSQYYRDHPEYNEIGHPEYESYFKMAREVNNGRDKEINDVKIIKNLCKETHLSREMIKES